MLAIISLSFADLADRRIIGVMLRSLLITLLLFAVLGVATGWLLDGSDPCSMAGLDACPLSASASGFGAVVLTLLGLWFLFPAIALGVICAYMDRINTIIEDRHYPLAAARARKTGVGGLALLGFKNMIRVLLYNLIALPFYILLLVTGIGPVILFVAVNGLAFGQDLGAMVVARHEDRNGRLLWLRSTRSSRLLIGSAVTALFLIPLVNLIAPILGAAMMTRLYHRTRTSGR